MPHSFKRTFLVEWHARSKSPTTALNAMRFVVEYGPMCDALGTEPSIDAYAEHVGASRSQAFRRQKAFRVCSPKQDVLSVWSIVKPLLEKSNFRAEGPRAQAIFGLSIVATWNTP